VRCHIYRSVLSDLGLIRMSAVCGCVHAVSETAYHIQVFDTALVPAQDDMLPAAAEQSGPTPQQPVLVLDMDAAPDAEPGTLGFGRLQVACCMAVLVS
jgi:hypothetical protein